MGHLLDNLSWEYKTYIYDKENIMQNKKNKTNVLLLIFYSHWDIFFLIFSN